MISILDNDLYKFTMQMAVLELFPNAVAEYQFINRGKHKFSGLFFLKLQERIQEYSYLRLTPQEKRWFAKTCPYLKPWYLDYLENYRFNPQEVHATCIDGDLKVSVLGQWHKTILWEVPLLAMISQTYFELVDTNWKYDSKEYKWDFIGKLLQLRDCHVSEFGTRRRRSFEVQRDIVAVGRKSMNNFAGTSNVYLSMENSLVPRGTMAHEWIMGNSVLESLQHANRYGLMNWNKVFNGNLGIALTDTYGLDAFLKDFDLNLAKLFDGVRHDSGDPFTWVDKIVLHYKELKIDSMSKTAFFSDNLNPRRAVDINTYCKGKIRASFGIGTNFTNDFEGSSPLNIVIKMFGLNGFPVVKLSEEPLKACGDKDALRVAKWIYFGKPLEE